MRDDSTARAECTVEARSRWVRGLVAVLALVVGAHGVGQAATVAGAQPAVPRKRASAIAHPPAPAVSLRTHEAPPSQPRLASGTGNVHALNRAGAGANRRTAFAAVKARASAAQPPIRPAAPRAVIARDTLRINPVSGLSGSIAGRRGSVSPIIGGPARYDARNGGVIDGAAMGHRR